MEEQVDLARVCPGLVCEVSIRNKYTVMVYIVMAYIVVAYTVMAYIARPTWCVLASFLRSPSEVKLIRPSAMCTPWPLPEALSLRVLLEAIPEWNQALQHLPCHGILAKEV